MIISSRLTISGRSQAGGFTLLEVLVAVTLLALLLTVGYAATRTATHSARSGEALIARTEELRTAQTFLRRQLAGALAQVYRVEDDGGIFFRFEGARDQLIFVATMPGYLSRGGPHVQRLMLVDARGGIQLEFNHSQLNGFDIDDEIGGDRDPVVLMAGIADASFEFRGLQPDGTFGDWTDDWEDPQLLPQQVRLRMEFGRDDLRYWPDLEVPLRLAGAAGLGPTTGRLDFGSPAPPPVVPRPGQ